MADKEASVPAREGERAPLAKGNGLAVKHGATAVLRLKPRAAEIAELLVELIPAFDQAYSPGVEAAALVAARCEAAFGALLDP